MTTLDDDNGKRKRRRLSKSATIAFCISLMPWLVGWLWWADYKHPPPPLSGFDGLGWFIGVYAIYALFLLTAWAGGLLAVLAAGCALADIHKSPKRLVGRKIAWLAILLSCSIMIVAVYVQSAVGLDAATSASYMPPRPRPLALMNRDNAHANEDLSNLLHGCQYYAGVHGGAYPPSADAYYTWAKAAGQSTPAHPEDYVYCGQGLNKYIRDKRLNETSPPRPDQNIIIWFSKPIPPNGVRALAMIDKAYGDEVTFHASEALPDLFKASNESRGWMNLGPVNFDALLATTQPATRP